MIAVVLKSMKIFLNKIIRRSLGLHQFFIRMKFFLNYDARTFLAERYLKGHGIEIGALNLPLTVPYCAHVKYVDRLSDRELRLQYPELKGQLLVKVDIIDDGETLSKINCGSQDFVIANHFLEHCENPIKAIESFLRVLKKDGILYLAVPDKRFTFDAGRSVTKLEHLWKDYTEGPECSRSEHFSEWRNLVNKKFINDPKRQIKILTSEKYSIHFHVWTYLELLELIVCLKQKLNLGFEVQSFVLTGSECIFIMKKHD